MKLEFSSSDKHRAASVGGPFFLNSASRFKSPLVCFRHEADVHELLINVRLLCDCVAKLGAEESARNI